jgi:hypothetical protein
MKDGFKTTEFWLTVASVAVTVGSVTGVIGTDDVTGVLHAAQNIVLTVFSLCSSILYIYGRLNLKRMERLGNKS